jgi:hypothetical protein
MPCRRGVTTARSARAPHRFSITPASVRSPKPLRISPASDEGSRPPLLVDACRDELEVDRGVFVDGGRVAGGEVGVVEPAEILVASVSVVGPQVGAVGRDQVEPVVERPQVLPDVDGDAQAATVS